MIKKLIEKIKKHENIIWFMEIFSIINLFLYIAVLGRIFNDYLYKTILGKYSIINWFDFIDMKYWILGCLVISIFFSLYLSRGIIWTIKLKDIDGIPSYTRYLEYYTWLLPKFLINLGLFFIILSVFNVYCIIIGIFLLGISPTGTIQKSSDF